MKDLKNQLNKKLQISAQESAENPVTELIPVESNYVALANNALEIITENLKNQPLTYQLFDVIKSPSGGTTAFTVPGLSGDEIHKEITGIILDYSTPRAYWDTPDPIEGTPPVCYSRDSVISHDGKSCAGCPFNDFGSRNKGDGNSNAKACKESVEILLLRPDNIMPIIVRVPVSSKILFQKYMARLVGQMIPISGVVTKITLEKTTNKTGQPYALYGFEMVGVLSANEAVSAKEFGRRFGEIFNSANQVDVVETV